MSVSIQQYRCAIGVYNNGMIVRGQNLNKFCYSVNLTETLRQILTIQNKNTNDQADTFVETCVSTFHILFVFFIYNFFGLLFSMHMDNCKVNSKLYNVYAEPMNHIMPITSFHSNLNWLTLLLLFRTPVGYNRHTFNPSIIHCIFRFRSYIKGYSTYGLLSAMYVKYTCVINLLLIIIVTPSIVNPGPGSHAKAYSSINILKVAYCNIQGLIIPSSMGRKEAIFQTNKLLEFQTYLHMQKPDICIVNESWLNEHINSNEIVHENFYKMFRLDRTDNDKNKYNKVGGGGVFILVKQGLQIETKLVNIVCEAPIVSIEIKFPDTSKICLSTFYRYGYSSFDMFNSVQQHYRELVRKYNKVLIIGDMNLNTIGNWNNPISSCSLENSYVDLFNDLGLNCLINLPTQKNGNTLDLLLTN